MTEINTRSKVSGPMPSLGVPAPNGSRPSPMALRARINSAENRVAVAARKLGAPLLRGAMGVVFIWFGMLKVGGTTPVADLVAGTVPWLDRSWFVPALGAAEIVMGAAVLVGRHMPLVCAVITAVGIRFSVTHRARGHH